MSVSFTHFFPHKRTLESSFLKDISEPENNYEPGLKTFYELFKYSTRIKLLNIYLIAIIGIIIFSGILFGLSEFWW